MKLSLIALTLFSLSVALAQPYYHTVHGETWGEGDIPPTGIPWKHITHFIPFAGNTGGAQTNGTSPYFQAPSGYEDAYHQQCHSLAKQNGVKYLLDLGFNQSGQFCAVANATGGIAMWAQTVGDYMIKYAYDGGDFDLEGGGCYADISMFAMALKNYLALKNPGKVYTLTTSIMMNAVDVVGWHVPQAVAGGWLDQVNGMWYDQCYPETSPLFPSSTHHCWSNDSAMVFQFAATGIPKNKIGLGYAIQVYTGCNTCYAKLGQQISNMLINGVVNNAGVQWDSESKARWYSWNGFNLAYEDTLTGWYKADFIKRNGFGGAVGFCLGRGYIANPPPGWDHNPAAYGFGRALLGSSPAPIDTTHPPVDTTHPPVVVKPVLLGFGIFDKATGVMNLKLTDGMRFNIHGLAPFTLRAIDSAGLSSQVTYGSPAAYTAPPPFNFGWPWMPKLGLTAISANGIGATGAVGPTLSITIMVVNDSTIPPPMNCFSQTQIDSTAKTNFAKGAASVVCAPQLDSTAVRQRYLNQILNSIPKP